MLTLPTKQMYIILLLCAQIFHHAHSRTKTFCENVIDLNRYSEKLHFVGEIGDLDFGHVNFTKTLHCCAYGFASIKWYKNYKPYPWPESSFVVDESSDNQTLVSKGAMMSDSGIYHCLVRNESRVLQHAFELKILAPESAESPRMSYAIKDQTGNIGDFARLYCEGFVGKSKKSNFSGTITWEKGLSDRYLDRAFIDGYRVIQMNYQRDENQILSSYLIFMNVEPSDLNMYTCRITNVNHRAVEQRAWILDSQDPEELARLLFMGLYAILPLFAITSVVALFAGLVLPLDIVNVWMRKFKRRYRKRPRRSKNILVVYHTDDQKLMSKTIIHKFLNLHPVKVTLYPVKNQEEDFKKLLKKAKTYDGVMVIMTSSLTGNEWSCENIYMSIKVISKLSTFVCVFTRKLPPLKGKSGLKLKGILKKAGFQMMNWRNTFTQNVLKAYLKKMNKKIVLHRGNLANTKKEPSGAEQV